MAQLRFPRILISRYEANVTVDEMNKWTEYLMAHEAYHQRLDLDEAIDAERLLIMAGGGNVSTLEGFRRRRRVSDTALFLLAKEWSAKLKASRGESEGTTDGL